MLIPYDPWLRKDLLAHIRQNGESSLAYAALQPNIKHFLDPDRGFIAYNLGGRFNESVIVLGKPICSDSDLEQLVESFSSSYPKAVYFQVDRQTAKVLNQFKYKINDFGLETYLDLTNETYRGKQVEQYSLAGKKKQNIRTAYNRAKKEGIEIIEKPFDDIDPSDILDISNEWILTKLVSTGELKYLARPIGINEDSGVALPDQPYLRYQDDEGVRVFFAYSPKGEILAFTIYDPIYYRGELVGYAANVLRKKKEAQDQLREPTDNRTGKEVTPGILDAINVEAMNRFKEESINIMALGLSPFADINDQEFITEDNLKGIHNLWTHNIFSFYYDHGNALFNFQKLTHHKALYRGREEKTFFAAKQKLMQLWHINNAYGVTGINVLTQIWRMLHT